jgi:hypothetical protein
MKRKVEALGLASGQERRKNFAPGFPQDLLAAETMRYLPEARSEFRMLSSLQERDRKEGGQNHIYQFEERSI